MPRRRPAARLLLQASFGAPTIEAENLVKFGDAASAPLIHSAVGKPISILPGMSRPAEACSRDQTDLRLARHSARAYKGGRLGQGGPIGVSLTAEAPSKLASRGRRTTMKFASASTRHQCARDPLSKKASPL